MNTTNTVLMLSALLVTGLAHADIGIGFGIGGRHGGPQVGIGLGIGDRTHSDDYYYDEEGYYDDAGVWVERRPYPAGKRYVMPREEVRTGEVRRLETTKQAPAVEQPTVKKSSTEATKN